MPLARKSASEGDGRRRVTEVVAPPGPPGPPRGSGALTCPSFARSPHGGGFGRLGERAAFVDNALGELPAKVDHFSTGLDIDRRARLARQPLDVSAHAIRSEKVRGSFAVGLPMWCES